jgi:hypothetical protein
VTAGLHDRLPQMGETWPFDASDMAAYAKWADLTVQARPVQAGERVHSRDPVPDLAGDLLV